MSAHKVRVLFVCLGNICRSPSAEGIFRAAVTAAGLQDKIEIDSGGSIAFQVGKAPDERAQRTARDHGIEIGDQRARLVNSSDFKTFDHIIAMDKNNMADLRANCPGDERHRLSLMMSHSTSANPAEVPDPYYGDIPFEQVWAMLTDACSGLLQRVRNEHNL